MSLRLSRERIVQTATQVFGEKGFSGTTIKDIAGALGVTPGSLYNYFSGKEQLFRCAVQEGWRRFLEEIQRIVTAPRQLEERFGGIIDYCFDSLKGALPLLRGMLFDARQRRLLQENLDRLCALLEGLILEGERQGLVRIPMPRGEVRPQIKIFVFGVLSSVALTQDEELEAEVLALKGAVNTTLLRRLNVPLQRRGDEQGGAV